MGFSETLTHFPNKKKERKKEEGKVSVEVEENKPSPASFWTKVQLLHLKNLGLDCWGCAGKNMQNQLMQNLNSCPSLTQALNFSTESILRNLTYPFHKMQRCCSCVCHSASFVQNYRQCRRNSSNLYCLLFLKIFWSMTITRCGPVLLCCDQRHIFWRISLVHTPCHYSLQWGLFSVFKMNAGDLLCHSQLR